jgi:hypothetical protein
MKPFTAVLLGDHYLATSLIIKNKPANSTITKRPTPLNLTKNLGREMEQHTLKNVNNGRESTVNRLLNGSIYSG